MGDGGGEGLKIAGVGARGINSFLLTRGSHISRLSLIKDRKATVQKGTLKNNSMRLSKGNLGLRPMTWHGWPGDGSSGSREGSWLVGRISCKDLRSDSGVRTISLLSIWEVTGKSRCKVGSCSSRGTGTRSDRMDHPWERRSSLVSLPASF